MPRQTQLDWLGAARLPARVPPAGARETATETAWDVDGRQAARSSSSKVNHTYRPPRGRTGARPVRRLARSAAARIPGAARALRLRKIHAALSGRRLPADRSRPHHWSKASRSRRPAPTAASCSSTLRCFPWKTVRGNILYGLERQGLPRAEREKRAQAFIDLVGLQRLRGQLSVATFRRHEAAHRDRPHAGLRSQHSVDGRAVRRARRADPLADADRAAEHLAAHAQDRDLRHPRRAGGGLSRRARGGDVGAARPHQGDRRHQIRQARSEHPAQQGVRRKGRRNLEPGARRGDQGAGDQGKRDAEHAASRFRYLPLLLLALAWEPRRGSTSSTHWPCRR